MTSLALQPSTAVPSNLSPQPRASEETDSLSFEFLPSSCTHLHCTGFGFPFTRHGAGVICKYSFRVFFLFFFFVLFLFTFSFLFFACVVDCSRARELYSARRPVENYNISFFIVTQPYLGGFILPNDNLTPGDEWLPAGRFLRLLRIALLVAPVSRIFLPLNLFDFSQSLFIYREQNKIPTGFFSSYLPSAIFALHDEFHAWLFCNDTR